MMKMIQLILVAMTGLALASALPHGSPNNRLIKTSEDKPAEWMDEQQVWALIERHQNFMDITDTKIPKFNPEDVNVKAIPTTLKYQTLVNSAIALINASRIREFVVAFSSYFNRYYTADTGLQSQAWLYQQVRSSIEQASSYPGVATVQEFTHPSWPQKSIIARLEGSDPTLKSEVVIVGAHQDSVNIAGSARQAPGADDNASGSVVCLESLRVLLAAGFVPKRTIEFHWYAAEEVGLRGSQAIAQQYKQTGINVVSMVNFDVPGYDAGTSEIGIYTDNTNAAINQFLRILVDEYCLYKKRDRTCGYGCSDHASWTQQGFPAGMPAEVVLHPQMHTINDNIDSVGFEQVGEFTKLSLGYLVEMSEPSS
jgi:leucyl aminopeptidase